MNDESTATESVTPSTSEQTAPDAGSLSQQPVKNSGCMKGCLTAAAIAFILLVITGLILYFTPSLWFVPTFKILFPEENHPDLYIKPELRQTDSSFQDNSWTRISLDRFSISVPFDGSLYEGDTSITGEIEHLYEFGDSSGISIRYADPSTANNFQAKQGCTLTVHELDQYSSFPEYVSASSALVIIESALDWGGFDGKPYYYINDNLFICQYGNISTQHDETEYIVGLMVTPNQASNEMETSSVSVLLYSDELTQAEIDQIVSTVEYLP